MPADWNSFVSNVSSKLDNQSFDASYDPDGENVNDFSTYLAQQYIDATVNKAQTPYGNTHQKGDDAILINSFTEAFKKLETQTSPTLDEKKKDPNYRSLNESPKKQDEQSSQDQFYLDFLAWTETNSTTINDFVYSYFFTQFPNFPLTKDQQVLEIARRIINRFDGSSDYLQWIYTLKLQDDELSDFSNQVYDKIIELTKGINQKEITVGDDVQGIALYPLLSNGNENTFQRSNGAGDIVRGKVVSIQATSGLTVYRVSTKFQGKVIQRTLGAESIQKKINVDDFKNVKDLNLSRKILQETSVNDPVRIPSYLTSKFITRFTYDPNTDKNLFTRIISKAQSYSGDTLKSFQTSSDQALSISNIIYSKEIQNFLAGNFTNISFTGSSLLNPNYLKSDSGKNDYTSIKGLLSAVSNRKISNYTLESASYLNLKRRYLDFLTTQEKKPVEDIDQQDPYQIMADGVIKYWVSCLDKPFSSSPPIPPCTITPPSNGVYLGIYYGSTSNLSDNIRRSFNNGKNLNDVKGGSLVANALAYSFQQQLAEMKFIYFGGIPTSNGPAPMTGFVSTVF
jgi:hypothetical protein